MRRKMRQLVEGWEGSWGDYGTREIQRQRAKYTGLAQCDLNSTRSMITTMHRMCSMISCWVTARCSRWCSLTMWMCWLCWYCCCYCLCGSWRLAPGVCRPPGTRRAPTTGCYSACRCRSGSDRPFGRLSLRSARSTLSNRSHGRFAASRAVPAPKRRRISMELNWLNLNRLILIKLKTI